MTDSSIVIIITALAPTLAGIAAVAVGVAGYYQAKASKVRSEENSESLKEVKHSVNSERTAMLKELGEHKEESAKLREVVATQNEKLTVLTNTLSALQEKRLEELQKTAEVKSSEVK